jgi:hypothetical protein
MIGIRIDGWERGSRLSRARVHANLIELTLVHGHGLWWTFASCSRCEAGPCCNISSVDGSAPSGEGWRKKARMVEGNASCNGIVS